MNLYCEQCGAKIKVMKQTKIKQSAESLLVVLSLFVSSIAACCCAHHEEKFEIETASCHAQTVETKAADHHDVRDSGEAAQFDVVNSNCECVVKSAPKIYAKNENVKFEKQALTSQTIKLPEAEFAVSIAAFQSVFVMPQYLSDSFYNFAPGRAPPRL